MVKELAKCSGSLTNNVQENRHSVSTDYDSQAQFLKK